MVRPKRLYHVGIESILTRILRLGREDLSTMKDQRGHLFWELLPNQTARTGASGGSTNSEATGSERSVSRDTGARAIVGSIALDLRPVHRLD